MVSCKAKRTFFVGLIGGQEERRSHELASYVIGRKFNLPKVGGARLANVRVSNIVLFSAPMKAETAKIV